MRKPSRARGLASTRPQRRRLSLSRASFHLARSSATRSVAMHAPSLDPAPTASSSSDTDCPGETNAWNMILEKFFCTPWLAASCGSSGAGAGPRRSRELQNFGVAGASTPCFGMAVRRPSGAGSGRSTSLNVFLRIRCRSVYFHRAEAFPPYFLLVTVYLLLATVFRLAVVGSTRAPTFVRKSLCSGNRAGRKIAGNTGSGSSSSSSPIRHWNCPSKGTIVRARARSFTRSLDLPGLGEEATTQLFPCKLQVRAINVLDQNRALEQRCARTHKLQSSDDFLLLAVVAALVNRGVLDRCFSLRVRAGGFKLVSR